MKILFIGGTGTISECVSKLAASKKDIDLYLFNRGNNRELMPENAEFIEGDIRNEKKAKEKLKKYNFDVVVNWVAFTPDHIKTDLSIFKGEIDQYIFISSASVYQKPPTNFIIRESTPLANPYWQYSRDKIACENILKKQYRENNFPAVIVRPSHTYGKTYIPASLNSSSHPWSLIDRMRKGKKVIVHGDGTSLWTLTHNSDFARGFLGLIGNDRVTGHAFHITSDEVLTWNQIYKTIGKAAGVEPQIVNISSNFISSYLPEKRGSFIGDKAVSCVFDNSKLKEFVPEYQATMPFYKGIKQTINWFESQPDKCKVDEEWNQLMDEIITGQENGLRK